MLTQEQARGLNIQQHELEDAELQQAKAQQSVDKYYNAMKVAMDSYDTLSPEKQAKVKELLPELQKGYEDAKNKRAYEEDRYWQALNKINEYKDLDTKQQAPQWWGQRRRTYNVEKFQRPDIRLNLSEWIDKTPVNYVPTWTVTDAAYWWQNGIADWMGNNIVYPYLTASSWMADKLGLITPEERAQNQNTMREIRSEAYNDSPTVNKDSKAYIYANEGAQWLWDLSRDMTVAAMVTPNVRTVPYNGPYELGYRAIPNRTLWYSTQALPYNMPAYNGSLPYTYWVLVR